MAHARVLVLVAAALASGCSESPGRPGAGSDTGVLLVDGGQPSTDGSSAPDRAIITPAPPPPPQAVDGGTSPVPQPDVGTSPTPKPDTSAPPPPPSGSCDPTFTGPFCTKQASGRMMITGFDGKPAGAVPTLDGLRKYSLDALNYIRARTCLPPLTMDACLNKHAQEATNYGMHAYFQKMCFNAAHGYGKTCDCGWAQENYGASYASQGCTWKDGIHTPLCKMMEEPKGAGHRGNIESTKWKRVGIGIKASSSGALWAHEFAP